MLLHTAAVWNSAVFRGAVQICNGTSENSAGDNAIDIKEEMLACPNTLASISA